MKSESSNVRTIQLYMVEARVKEVHPTRPLIINDKIITEKWGRVNPDIIPGLKMKPDIFVADEESFLSYEAAMCLAYFVLSHETILSDTEARLVKYTCKKQTELIREGIVEGLPVLTTIMSRPNIIKEEPNETE